MRIGIGFDVHPLVEGRKLILGGVEIPHEKGPYGHSDADVLVHAICDALLGAMGKGDLGRHFPDTEPRYKDACSLNFLARIRALMDEEGWKLGNVDATILCEKPKLLPYGERMVENIARALGVEREKINVKATRGEGLGFIGRGEGVAAYAVATVIR